MPARPVALDEEKIWERDYRQFVNGRFDKLEQHNETLATQLTLHAQIIERILARLDTLEAKPREARAVFGLANSVVYTVIGIAGMLIALAGLGFMAFTALLSVASTVAALIAIFHH